MPVHSQVKMWGGNAPQTPAKRSTLQAKTPAPRAKDQLITGLLVLILFGTPLAIAPARVPTYETTPKLVILYLGSALLLWHASRWWPGIAALWRTPVGRAFYSLLILSVASLVVSSAFSNDPWLSFGGTVWRRSGAVNQAVLVLVIAALAGYVFLDRTALRRLMLGMELAGAVAGIYAILQYAGWDPLIPAQVYTLGSGAAAAVRPPATLTQATFFATFLLTPIFVCIWFRLSEKSSRGKRMHELILLLLVAALVLTGTRSALIGLVAGALALVCIGRKRIPLWKTLARAAYLFLPLAAIAAIFLLLPFGRGVRARFAQWQADPVGGPRLLVWRDSLPLLRQGFASGIGPELFETEFRKAESLRLAQAYPDHYHESPHNFFLEIGIAQGCVGLAVWAALLASALRCGWIGCRQGDYEAAPLVAALVAMVVSLQFCPLILTNELYLLTLCAMLTARAAQQAVTQPYTFVSHPVVIAAARVLGILFVFVASAYVAEAILYSLTEDRVWHGDLAGAERSYAFARKFPMPGANLAVSRQVASLARRFPAPVRQEALSLAAQAAEAGECGNAERFNALYQSATLAIISGDLPRAEAKLRAAIEASPVWYRPRMALACVLWWQGRTEEAQREGELALNRAGNLKSYVKRTLEGARAQATVLAARPSP